jgi:two-component system alkaline phosphatase synthesis response regulator PhoP
MPVILIVEDEPDMAAGLRDNCEFEGFRAVVAADGDQAIAKALDEKPDIVLLDVMLPKRSGFEVCRELRRRGFAAPIVMLTARGQETDKVVGFELGADDYVTKPFGVRELMARLRAHLRRTSRNAHSIETYSFGDVELDFRKHYAAKGGQRVTLSPREFELLKYFIAHRGETVTRDELLDRVWGLHVYPFTRTVDNHIAKLRQKIERFPAEPEFLITVHKVGYKFLG